MWNDKSFLNLLIALLILSFLMATNEGILLIFALLLIIIPVKAPKKKLREEYGVSKNTIEKWLKYFIPNSLYLETKGKRQISLFDYLNILSNLGDGYPREKWSIAEELNCMYSNGNINYKLLKEGDATFMVDLGYSTASYIHCNTFPPKVSKDIIEYLK